MGRDNNTTIVTQTKLGGVGFLAYVVEFFLLFKVFYSVFFFVLAISFVILAILRFYSVTLNEAVFWERVLAFAGVVFVAIVFHRFLVLRSTEVYFDEDGVWVYSGVLPWERGSRGINWRDFGGARFSGSFFGWLFKSNTIFLYHRYTGSVIEIPHCAHGEEVVTAINRKHQELMKVGLIPNLTQGDT